MLEIINNNENLFQITNEVVFLTFYKTGIKKGHYEIRYHKGNDTQLVLKNCYSAIYYFTQNSDELLEVCSKNYEFHNEIEEINDSIGKGIKIVFKRIISEDKEIQFKIQFKIYEKKEFILVKVIDIMEKDESTGYLGRHTSRRLL